MKTYEVLFVTPRGNGWAIVNADNASSVRNILENQSRFAQLNILHIIEKPLVCDLTTSIVYEGYCETSDSPYWIWLSSGHSGSEADFLEWLRGEDGTNGKSAYEIWLDNGHTGTEEDFLNWLRYGVVPAISELNDTDVNNVSDGQILIYNGTSEKWENRDIPANLANIKYGTTSYWNSQTGYIPDEGTIIVYTDYDYKVVDNDNVPIPGIKIGSGNAYVQDLAFVSEDIAIDLSEHINNHTIHVTQSDKNSWNNKLNVDDNFEVIDGALVFNRN